MKNPITSIIGVVVALCPIVSAIFPEAQSICEQLTSELIGLGFITAADGVKLPSVPTKNVAAFFGGLLLIVGLSSCAQLDSLAKAVNPFKGAINSQLAELTSGEYKVAITKDGKELWSETVVCTKNEQELTGCHKK